MNLTYLKTISLKKVNRKLIVSKSGLWYLFFTILLGVFALIINNNILFMIESLLLAGLILSGIISEKIINSVEFSIIHSQAIKGEPTCDWITLKNKSKKTLFSIEISEISEGNVTPLYYIQQLGRSAEITERLQRVFHKRGHHEWEGYEISTSFPFGFAKKIKKKNQKGSRIIWIEKKSTDVLRSHFKSPSSVFRKIESHPIEGEVRPHLYDEDTRSLVHSKSAMGIGLFSQNNKRTTDENEVTLDLSKIDPKKLEQTLMESASLFYSRKATKLHLKTKQKNNKIIGMKQSINAISLLKSEHL